MLTWEEICSDPHLQNLPYKIEQDRYGRILMSPVKSDHSEFQGRIAALLARFLPGWSILVECAIDTAQGTKVADVAAMTRARRLPYRGAASLPVAPEICVEVQSGSNTREELDEKRRLYAAGGCEEFWTCAEDGVVGFQRARDGTRLLRSGICPEFPPQIDL
ncbi:MAG: Uma2 family endonuclease [Verrucomicrobia bacterium]|nr:Uma2 family endonuclease [Verrucomicrobiota bacterium]